MTAISLTSDIWPRHSSSMPFSEFDVGRLLEVPFLNPSTPQPLNLSTLFENVKCLGRGNALRPLDLTLSSCLRKRALPCIMWTELSAASLSKSSAEVCARLHRDGARNPPKYSHRMDTPPDSPPEGDNANACTSRARGRDFSGQPARTGPSKLAPFPGAKRPREIQSEDEKPRGNARRAAARNGR